MFFRVIYDGYEKLFILVKVINIYIEYLNVMWYKLLYN